MTERMSSLTERTSSPRRRGSNLLESLEPPLLGAHLAPLKSRLEALLSTGERSADEVRKRIRVIPMGARKHEPKHFEGVPDKELNEVLASGYGILSGKKVQWATLKFTPERARYVAMEEWHPRQRFHFETDGSYIPNVPFSSSGELVMNILKFGSEVELLEPRSLRVQVHGAAVNLLDKYT